MRVKGSVKSQGVGSGEVLKLEAIVHPVAGALE
jgi:hypothetical protein